MELKHIKTKIKTGGYDISIHAVERSIKRHIWKEDIEAAVLNGEIIEEYLDDKPFPTYLIFGKTKKDKPLHIVCSNSPRPKIITAYEPKKERWINYRIRKK